MQSADHMVFSQKHTLLLGVSETSALDFDMSRMSEETKFKSLLVHESLKLRSVGLRKEWA